MMRCTISRASNEVLRVDAGALAGRLPVRSILHEPVANS
jgi:hypothetical protein